jgi:hypothetical protein
MKQNPLTKLLRSTIPFGPLGIVVVALAVFLGALDWVPAAEAHLLVDAAGDSLCTPSAIHPNQALHVERSTVAQRPWSPARMHQMRAKTAKLGGSVAVAPPLLRSVLVESPDLAAIAAHRRPSGARAPPFA